MRCVIGFMNRTLCGVVVAAGYVISGCSGTPPDPRPTLAPWLEETPAPPVGTWRFSATIFEVARVTTAVRVLDQPTSVARVVEELTHLEPDEVRWIRTPWAEVAEGAAIRIEIPAPTDSGQYGSIEVQFGSTGERSRLDFVLRSFSHWVTPSVDRLSARAQAELDLAPGRLVVVSTPSEPDRSTTFILVLALDAN